MISGVFSACGSMGGLSGVTNCSNYNGTWWNGTCYTVEEVGPDVYQTVSIDLVGRSRGARDACPL